MDNFCLRKLWREVTVLTCQILCLNMLEFWYTSEFPSPIVLGFMAEDMHTLLLSTIILCLIWIPRRSMLWLTLLSNYDFFQEMVAASASAFISNLCCIANLELLYLNFVLKVNDVRIRHESLFGDELSDTSIICCSHNDTSHHHLWHAHGISGIKCVSEVDKVNCVYSFLFMIRIAVTSI